MHLSYLTNIEQCSDDKATAQFQKYVELFGWNEVKDGKLSLTEFFWEGLNTEKHNIIVNRLFEELV